MVTRLVQPLILTTAITLGAYVSLNQCLAPLVQAQFFTQLSPAAGNYQPSTVDSSEAAFTPMTALSNINPSTYSVFLPLLTYQPVPDPAIQVVNETNYQRSLYGCPALALNQQLVTAGQGHSEDMAFNDFFSHTGSDGYSPWQRIQETGYQFSLAAENIAAGYNTPQAVMQAWMNSSGHRANILNCSLQEIGVGYSYLADDTGTVNYHHYWTQVLASPK